MTTTIKTHTWNNCPIEYRPLVLDAAYDGVTLINSTEYLWPNGDTRYVAIQGGEVIAVQTDYNFFCNMVVNPLFPGGKRGYFPYFEKQADGTLVYVVPVVPQEAK